MSILDLAAFPIAIALTLWDAVPVYLSIGLAVTIVIHTLLPRQVIYPVWHFRERIGIEGVVYVLLFQPILAPAMLVASGASMAIHWCASTVPSRAIATPGQAISARLGELVSTVALASVVAALMKLGGPHLPGTLAAVIVAGIGGFVVGNRSGVTAIPAMASFWHLGGWLPCLACIAGAIAREFAPVIRRSQESSASGEDAVSSSFPSAS